MIYTVTMNPCLDYVVELERLEVGRTNRAVRENIRAGGKGVNVSLMLSRLGMDSTATGFAAGFTGREIAAQLRRANIREEFLEVGGVSRINVKLWAQEETEVNGAGPQISVQDVERLLNVLLKASERDVLVLSGSIPPSLPVETYGDLARWAEERAIPLIVDAAGELLRNTLPYRPFLIKPNQKELEDLFDHTLDSEEDLIRAAEDLRREGAANVLVSLGGDGAILAAENAVYRAQAPKGTVVGTVGAGDSMVAGFLYGYEKTHDLREAFIWAVASGSATAFSEGLGSRETVVSLAPDVKLDRRSWNDQVT